MNILPIIQLQLEQFKDKSTTLRSSSANVDDFGELFQSQLQDLVQTFRSHRIAVGLAAPQLGIQRRFSVINISKDKGDRDLVIVNPKIISFSRESELKHESCMSLPHFRGKVERPKKISISYFDEMGKPKRLAAEGFLARVLCHEIDHLDGILYVDKMLDLSKLESVDFFKDD